MQPMPLTPPIPKLLHATPPQPPMQAKTLPSLRWDIFCRVIDNFGDIGICWRLSADLAARGHKVRLWVDDASALQWMAPGALQGCWPNVAVHKWSDSQDVNEIIKLPPADVWIEGFGCEIAPEFIAATAHITRAKGQNGIKNPIWINLEYLSAEGYVERCHGLPSPVTQGPAQGWIKHFFYPGFTSRTGGLLREPNLIQRQQAFAQPGQREAWLMRHGITWRGERLVSLFCYEPKALRSLLGQLEASEQRTLLLVTAGRACKAVQALAGEHPGLQLAYLPPLTQQDFDHLLWTCDLNLVRGEDSVIRAIWAGKPLIWQIYPQQDAAHHDKLDAFLDMLEADDALRQSHYIWNDMANDPVKNDPLQLTHLNQWTQTIQSVRERLMQIDDLVTQLAAFVLKKR